MQIGNSLGSEATVQLSEKTAKARISEDPDYRRQQRDEIETIIGAI